MSSTRALSEATFLLQFQCARTRRLSHEFIRSPLLTQSKCRARVHQQRQYCFSSAHAPGVPLMHPFVRACHTPLIEMSSTRAPSKAKYCFSSAHVPGVQNMHSFIASLFSIKMSTMPLITSHRCTPAPFQWRRRRHSLRKRNGTHR